MTNLTITVSVHLVESRAELLRLKLVVGLDIAVFHHAEELVERQHPVVVLVHLQELGLATESKKGQRASGDLLSRGKT